MRHWPALDILEADDLLLAALDDFSPTAIEGREPGLRVFFATRGQRDAALAELTGPQTVLVALEVSDEDWAVRSQQSLTPIVVGRVRIVPHARFLNPAALTLPAAPLDTLEIVIEAVDGLRHRTSRHDPPVSRRAQTLDPDPDEGPRRGHWIGNPVDSRRASRRLHVHGIDYDADAIQSANDNLALNRTPGA